MIRRKRSGRTQIITLGAYPETTLKAARLKAAQYQLKQDVSAVTVAELAQKYIGEVIERTRRRPEMVQGYMDRAIIPTLGRRKVRDVTRAECVDLIQRYAVEHGYNGKPASRSADQLRSILKKMFGYGVELGLIDSNPVTEVTRRVAGYIPVARDRVLSDDEIRLLWKETNHNAAILRFILLTGLRIGEAQKGRIDDTGRRWVVTERLSKNKQPHWAHLTPAALKQLPLPFCTTTNVQAWLRRWCDNHNISPRFTPHDLRRSFVTRCNDLGVMPHIVEKCVNHKLEGVLAVYNRAEHEQERIEAAERLTAHVLEVVE